MTRLFLLDKHSGLKVPLGLFKFNDATKCHRTARNRHKWITKLQCHCWEFEAKREKGPLRPPKRDIQLSRKDNEKAVSVPAKHAR